MFVRKIKKYPNRRLYDTEASAYIKSSDLRAFLMAGERLCITDVSTERDITRSVLLSLLAEEATDENAISILSEKMLSETVRFDNALLSGLAAQFLEKSLDVFLRHHTLFQAQMQNFELENPLSTIDALIATQSALLSDMEEKLVKTKGYDEKLDN